VQGERPTVASCVLWRLQNQGTITPICTLVLAMNHGHGVAKDAEQAVSWYRRAADAGDASAQYNLGLCYADGDGVAKDSELALSWYRRAAEAGHADAQYKLGYCYSKW